MYGHTNIVGVAIKTDEARVGAGGNTGDKHRPTLPCRATENGGVCLAGIMYEREGAGKNVTSWPSKYFCLAKENTMSNENKS